MYFFTSFLAEAEYSVTTASFVAATQKDRRRRMGKEKERRRDEDVKGVSFRDRERERRERSGKTYAIVYDVNSLNKRF